MTTSVPLTPESIAPLVRNTIFSGNIYCFGQVDSTNSLALAAAQSRPADLAREGAVFLAEEQTAGRGRGGHSWHSEPGAGIYCSFLLRPSLSPADALWFSLSAGVAVHDAVHETTGLSPDLRWPNDVLLDEKKFAGILTEMSTEASRVQHAVVGIGINVNQESFPPDLRDAATSLRIESGQEWPRLELTAALVRAVDREYRGLLRTTSGPVRTPNLRFEPIIKRVESRSSYASGKAVHVDEDGGYSGVTDGLDPRGFLRVRTDRGLRIVVSGGVRPLERRSDVAGS